MTKTPRELLLEARALIPWSAAGRHIWLIGAHACYPVLLGVRMFNRHYRDRQFAYLCRPAATAEEAAPAA